MVFFLKQFLSPLFIYWWDIFGGYTENFSLLCYAAIESIDIPRILSQQGGEAVYPLPRIKSLEVHPKLNQAALLFAVSIALTA